MYEMRENMNYWSADLKNGEYKNPILHTDYSDPDVIAVNGEFYMIASSFTYLPGVPLLHSRDLVNWEPVSYTHLPRISCGRRFTAS